MGTLGSRSRSAAAAWQFSSASFPEAFAVAAGNSTDTESAASLAT